MFKLFKALFHRSILVAALIVIQLIILVAITLEFSTYFVYFNYLFTAVAMIFVIAILNNGKSNPTYKMAWVIIILLAPVFGGLFYLVFGRQHLNKYQKAKMEIINQKMREAFHSNQALAQMRFHGRAATAQSHYISNYALSPPHANTFTEYLPTGEQFFERLKEELNKAERYIFMEYFIIERGIMWDGILEILAAKVKAGVEVRLIYDDMGCIAKLPLGYYKSLRALGINCIVFNPFRPVLNSSFNNRDHRKITVIDGKVGFTGGINLSDEYINQKALYGHWKDSAIMLKGAAVFNLSVMFLSLWDYLSGKDENFNTFRAHAYENGYGENGYVQPYSDSPLDDEPVGQNVYLNLIQRAKDYVYITTPYLIVDNEMASALCLAAKGGIDVRIITPHIPDKRYVHAVTRAYYEDLAEAGVKIYEYLPGFMHAKTFVVDDVYGVVGTINMDFRSLYLHFECGVWLYDTTETIAAIKADFLATQKKSKYISLAECRNIPVYKRVSRMFLRAFSPLM